MSEISWLLPIATRRYRDSANLVARLHAEPAVKMESQADYDLWHAEQRGRPSIEAIKQAA